MRRGHADGTASPLLRCHEAPALALEPEHLHPLDVEAVEIGAEAIRHGAEIFAEHQSTGTMRLQSGQSQEIGQRIAEISTLARIRAIRDDPEPAKTEDVVDADAARILQGAPQQLNE